MTTYLVTGGAGFIGSNLTVALVERGANVRVLDDLSSGHRSNLSEVSQDIEFIEADCEMNLHLPRHVRVSTLFCTRPQFRR